MHPLSDVRYRVDNTISLQFLSHDVNKDAKICLHLDMVCDKINLIINLYEDMK